MCYLVREQQTGAAERDPMIPRPNVDRLRPRWIGAGAAALIGGLAVAAMVAPPSVSPPSNTKDAAAPAPLAANAGAMATAAVEQRSAPVDDGVPGTDVVKPAGALCEHGL